MGQQHVMYYDGEQSGRADELTAWASESENQRNPAQHAGSRTKKDDEIFVVDK